MNDAHDNAQNDREILERIRHGEAVDELIAVAAEKQADLIDAFGDDFHNLVMRFERLGLRPEDIEREIVECLRVRVGYSHTPTA